MSGRSIADTEVILERRWALDLKYIDKELFEKEFRLRNPRSDVIPDRYKFLEYKNPFNRSIDAFNPEVLIPEDVVIKNKTVSKNWNCKGCNKEFKDNTIGRRNHIRACKGFGDQKPEGINYG